MSAAAPELRNRRGDYGFDAPLVPMLLAAGGIALIVLAVLNFTVWASGPWGIFSLAGGLFMLLSAAIFVYTTRSGWSRRPGSRRRS